MDILLFILHLNYVLLDIILFTTLKIWYQVNIKYEYDMNLVTWHLYKDANYNDTFLPI